MVRLDRFLSLYFFGPLLKKFQSSRGAAIPILMYHSISEDPEIGVPNYYRVVTSPVRFREHMRWLSKNRYAVLGLSEALRLLGTQTADLRHCVVLTFDDGFHDFLNNAWPVLKEYNHTATVFLPTDFIGAKPNSFKGRRCLTWSEARELQFHGISFGSHTASHPKLYRIQWDDVQRELLVSRRQIENELQISVTSFSYPYAFPQEDRHFVRRFLNELRDQGYRNAVTTSIGRAGLESDPLCLQRLPINDSDDLQFFKAKITGAYDWMAQMQALFRGAKFRLLGNRLFNA